jgi:transposase
MFAAGERQSRVARVLGLSRQCIHNWYRSWQEKGTRARASRKPGSGRKSKLSREQLAQVEAALRRGPRNFGFASEHWTLWRVATVIAGVTGVQYHPSSVWRILHTLGWSLRRLPPGDQETRRASGYVRRHWVAPDSVAAPRQADA